MTSRYQAGALEKRKTKQGLFWFLRFRKPAGGKEGKRPRPRIPVGPVSEYPTKSAARRAADVLRKDFNRQPVIDKAGTTFAHLAERFTLEELPRQHSTAKGYESYLRCHLLPRWGEYRLIDIRKTDVRDWLLALKKQNGDKVSDRTRGHARDLMRVLFGFAALWDLIPDGPNPISSFRLKDSTKRAKVPRSLTQEEFLRMLSHISQEPHRTMVMTAGFLGLGRCEVTALRWYDIDFDRRVLKVQRGIVDGHIGKTKNEYREAELPLHPHLAEHLLKHYERSMYTRPDDWIFASPHSAGERPYHPSNIQETVIARAALAAGLGKGIGWHTFRHSYRSWMGTKQIPAEQQRKLMRHSTIATTMNVYGTTFDEQLREANETAVRGLVQ